VEEDTITMVMDTTIIKIGVAAAVGTGVVIKPGIIAGVAVAAATNALLIGAAVVVGAVVALTSRPQFVVICGGTGLTAMAAVVGAGGRALAN
jgi:hypothetical protein